MHFFLLLDRVSPDFLSDFPGAWGRLYGTTRCAHSASAVALHVMLALIAGTALRGRVRGSAWAAAIALALAIGVSRVYLGAHYPADVLAGWLTGGILVVGSWALCARLPIRGRAPAAA
jgi:membrane-associated phospholipid phosphatase